LNAIGAERVDLLRRNVEWRLEISDTLSDGYFTGDGDPPVGEGKLCVSASCGGAGYFRIGAALDALEREAIGLGAAFYWSLVRSLYRVMRIYDHDSSAPPIPDEAFTVSHESHGLNSRRNKCLTLLTLGCWNPFPKAKRFNYYRQTKDS
jgi:hypothetical protein